ncbi:MAG: hypothetical protein ISS59_06420 [Desulfobacteraceae bacterium]|nr:hypothetical protein [Desulfobacteraceae bacterium]
MNPAYAGKRLSKAQATQQKENVFFPLKLCCRSLTYELPDMGGKVTTAELGRAISEAVEPRS